MDLHHRNGSERVRTTLRGAVGLAAAVLLDYSGCGEVHSPKINHI